MHNGKMKNSTRRSCKVLCIVLFGLLPVDHKSLSECVSHPSVWDLHHFFFFVLKRKKQSSAVLETHRNMNHRRPLSLKLTVLFFSYSIVFVLLKETLTPFTVSKLVSNKFFPYVVFR